MKIITDKDIDYQESLMTKYIKEKAEAINNLSEEWSCEIIKNECGKLIYVEVKNNGILHFTIGSLCEGKGLTIGSLSKCCHRLVMIEQWIKEE